MEAGEEFPVELLEREVFPAVFIRNIVRKVPAYAPIFIICCFAAGDSDHALELFVMLPEKSDERFVVVADAEIHLLDHHGRYISLIVKERVVTPLDVEMDIRKLLVDAEGGIAPPGDTPHADVPLIGAHR